MRDFPLSMLDTANSENFWKDCEELLHVVAANKISSPIFGQRLQALVYGRLKKAVDANKIETVDSVDHAALAVGRRTSIGTVEFSKFSTPGPLLALQQKQRHLANEGKGSPLTIATDTIVQRFETDPEDPLNRPSILHTSRGALRFSKTTTNLVLAAGAFPNTTILMNSVGEQLKGRAGSRVSGHFLTQIVARFPIPRSAENPERPLSKHLEIGAHYMAGKDSTSDLQYHVQITAIHSPRPETDAEDAARLSPDQAGAATFEQLKDSGQHIVLVCAALGELDELDTGSWFKHDPNNPDVTTNSHLQVLLSEKAERLWDVMDQVTYDAINVMAGGVSNDIEYWSHSNVPSVPPGWSRDQPPQCMIRVPGIVHETATLYMSDDLETDPHASVDSDYRPHSCHNVFVTGGALFPTSGSWNPTLTMCGFAQDLAKKLHEVRKSETSSPS
ncbi:hypothetical protein EUX98_g1509 [Antrodiella citrinella]|uniref:Glucose-methanol-choline oxidoreductase C-terminal domain-containing protein n=1 Tax=Antrodiella citrinella TaxID=2447956 RepID=A0A4S4N475_9APHY|nr:hypothetical protein EUX98_g1509 [Antrodiella citrinella]